MRYGCDPLETQGEISGKQMDIESAFGRSGQEKYICEPLAHRLCLMPWGFLENYQGVYVL